MEDGEDGNKPTVMSTFLRKANVEVQSDESKDKIIIKFQLK